MSEWFDEVYQDNLRLGLRVLKHVYHSQSKFQTIDIVDTEMYGRALALDGCFMTSDKEEFFYHESLVHPVLCSAPCIEKVLIIGGGDGGTSREVLRYAEVQNVRLVEIDGEVVEACKEHMPHIGGSAWQDPRLDLRIEDGVAYVKQEQSGIYDIILLDSTDPIGPGVGLFNREFYAECKRLLKPHGVLALQSESPVMMPKGFASIQHNLRAVFPKVFPYFGPVPIYNTGIWSWTYASAEATPHETNAARVNMIVPGCRYYNEAVHRGMFAVPNYVKGLLHSDPLTLEKQTDNKVKAAPLA
ncbi:MAG: polyamine aminopropyltransferase [Myxococcales bacterium]|nr:MAG: polyamine aminopropyltransferase [Myxococcales bacterium]